MDNLEENMRLNAYFEHFEITGEECLYFDVHGEKENAAWLYCGKACRIAGQEVERGDMVLYEKNTGAVRGIFKPLANASKQTKPTDTD